MEFIENKYNTLCNENSDINEHLPTLFKYASDCESIIELGVRGCVSSWAFVYGLLNNNKQNKKILLNDIEKCNIDELLDYTKELDIDVNYEWKNDLDLVINENVDLVFIDSWHIYGQLIRELNKFSKVTNKYIIMHDTEVDKIYGETIREGGNPYKRSQESGYPVEEIICGLQLAIDEFLEKNSDWILLEKFENNNGLTILKKIL